MADCQSDSNETKDDLVVQHYSVLKETHHSDRSKSKIFHLRSFNNWIKTVLISECVKRRNIDKHSRVLDFGCGKGGDVTKWRRMKPQRLAFLDFCEIALQQCKERYEKVNQSTSSGSNGKSLDDTCETSFHVLNVCDDLRSEFEQGEFNIISCQFVVHYIFNCFDNVKAFLRNVSYLLKPGGLFFGTTTDCFELVRRWDIERTRNPNSTIIDNGVYSIDFSRLTFPPKLFGAEIDFKLDELINCPEYLIYFPAFKRIAEDFNLDLIYCKNFKDFFTENCKKQRHLLSIMEALKPYPLDEPHDNSNLSYEHARIVYNKMNKAGSRLGTLSKEEWEAATIYVCFIFKRRQG
ncbi:hypothetical protein GJ496_008665 [Pomphorhynchus laevis]|nr:hypothetical protein GJ496_008665 [Pomphorhynchus laevis]